MAPVLPAWEHHVRDADPALADPKVLDRALRKALTALRLEAAQQTFVYLRWRVEQARAAVAATTAAAAAARRARAAARGGAPPAAELPAGVDPAAAGPGAPRTFRVVDGATWCVREIAFVDVPWAQSPRCLLFQSETAIRRVWHYPADWRALPDAALEALSWQT